MNESDLILRSLHDEVAGLPSEIVRGVGRTKHGIALFNDSAELTVQLHHDVDARRLHCHIQTSLPSELSGFLDACCVFVHNDRSIALRRAEEEWMVQKLYGDIYNLRDASAPFLSRPGK